MSQQQQSNSQYNGVGGIKSLTPSQLAQVASSLQSLQQQPSSALAALATLNEQYQQQANNSASQQHLLSALNSKQPTTPAANQQPSSHLQQLMRGCFDPSTSQQMATYYSLIANAAAGIYPPTTQSATAATDSSRPHK